MSIKHWPATPLTSTPGESIRKTSACPQSTVCDDKERHCIIKQDDVTRLCADSAKEQPYDFLKENQFTPFPRGHIQEFAQCSLDGVALLHYLQLIHTDLKPENILLVDSAYDSHSMPPGMGRRGQSRHILCSTAIRLIDFGSATFSAEYRSTVVRTGYLLSTGDHSRSWYWQDWELELLAMATKQPATQDTYFDFSRAI
ncbi:unnamed protein product [Rhizoctonia solani]|uniref:Protein kinase domain-containing protein n=1 Tax=Rhizoctonia solani TaxID=456999 RepID=A0A8H3AYJ6_9AGAM|nr:unnamed protein product [Rhizoctonia solani]